MKFNECPYCGAHLDFGEACDCKAQGQEDGQRAAKGGEQYLGTAIDPLEWDGAKAYAEHKLKRIIDREGDADGARREPWYLAQLIAETVRGNRFSRLTKLVYELTEQFGVKKEQPTSENVSRPKTDTPIVAQETSECNRRI